MDFPSVETSNEIKQILNQEILDSECKCFTGRLNRIVNCLSGFSSLVTIQINDSDQISNVIIIVKKQLLLSNKYSIDEHKRLVKSDLEDRGYDSDTIAVWLEFIE